ncbi:hypothetical protein PHJA_001211000 [Phtheirospermum japonicum]|uniref:UspA domain-containing protein n=1 Tax=Phtheirospermum japonicum TaxID=374723 RepID=A0A830BWF7_9LAMI|nr:hypothetical protein PHJA_001211000 [Phtheirospermum japonicum]
MTAFCISPVVAAGVRVRARVRSPLKQHKKSPSLINRAEGDSELIISNEINDLMSLNWHCNLSDHECGGNNRVMVVIDSNSEAKGALEWALSHTVQSQDTLILLHAARKLDGKTHGGIDQRAFNLLQSMKNMCELRRPEVHVEIAIREGREKGAIIVEAVKQLKVSLLVLGHQKQSLLRQFPKIWTSKRKRNNRLVDHCIQNANCMTLAVRRKNRKYGGYLITTKRHNNFWLLA